MCLPLPSSNVNLSSTLAFGNAFAKEIRSVFRFRRRLNRRSTRFLFHDVCPCSATFEFAADGIFIVSIVKRFLYILISIHSVYFYVHRRLRSSSSRFARWFTLSRRIFTCNIYGEFERSVGFSFDSLFGGRGVETATRNGKRNER